MVVMQGMVIGIEPGNARSRIGERHVAFDAEPRRFLIDRVEPERALDLLDHRERHAGISREQMRARQL